MVRVCNAVRKINYAIPAVIDDQRWSKHLHFVNKYVRKLLLSLKQCTSKGKSKGFAFFLLYCACYR